MKRILVTGAAGQVGCRVVRQLLQKGYEVRGLILPDDPLAHRLSGLEIEVVAANLLDPGVAEAAVAGVDGVIHTANLVSPLPGMSEAAWFDNNVRTIFNLAQAAAGRADEIERFVSLSSSSVYPNDSHVLACAYHPVDEQHPKRPEPLYALSKWLGEEIVRAFERSAGLRAALIRPSGIVSGTDILGRWNAGFVGLILQIGLSSPRSEMYLGPSAGEPWKKLAAAARRPPTALRSD